MGKGGGLFGIASKLVKKTPKVKLPKTPKLKRPKRPKKGSGKWFGSKKKPGSNKFFGSKKKPGSKKPDMKGSKKVDGRPSKKVDPKKDLDADDMKKVDPGLLRSMGRACKKNPATCVKYGAVGATAGYVAVKWHKKSAKQRDCITRCLPVNWGNRETEDVQYHETAEDENGDPRCTEGNCDEFCQQKCETKYPDQLGAAIGEAVGDVVSGTLDQLLFPALEALGIPLSNLTGPVMMVVRIVAVIVIFKVVMVFKPLFWKGKGGATLARYSPPPPQYAPPPPPQYAPPPPQ